MKTLPFSFINQQKSLPDWFTGSDNDLIITNGQTVNLTAPFIKQYNNIRIDAGGTLNITGSGDIAQLIAGESCTINGNIIYRATERNGYSYSGTTISGIPYSHTATQSAGGRGGRARSGYNEGWNISGGSGTNGYGGGGAGGYGGGDTPVIGGAGGSNNGSGSRGEFTKFTTAGLGGSGNVTNGHGNSGQNSDGIGDSTPGNGGSGGGSGGGGGGLFTLASFGDFPYSGAGGGGGGHKGLHGGILFIYSQNEILGNGSVYVNGTNGFNGGVGGRCTSAAIYGGDGGGGGGGAGGSGGKVIIQTISESLQKVVSGGSGGSGGAAIAGGSVAGGNAESGLSGFSGNNGTIQSIFLE